MHESQALFHRVVSPPQKRSNPPKMEPDRRACLFSRPTLPLGWKRFLGGPGAKGQKGQAGPGRLRLSWSKWQNLDAGQTSNPKTGCTFFVERGTLLIGGAAGFSGASLLLEGPPPYSQTGQTSTPSPPKNAVMPFIC